MPRPAAIDEGRQTANKGRRKPPFLFQELASHMAEAHSGTSPSPFVTGLAGRCPHCGKGRLFDGFLALQPRCETCGLDFSFADSGDGPAVFVILIAGFIVVGCALIVEIKYQPPFWLHAALWLPLILATTLLPLRSMKSLLIALQYHHKAAPGRLIDREPK